MPGIASRIPRGNNTIQETKHDRPEDNISIGVYSVPIHMSVYSMIYVHVCIYIYTATRLEQGLLQSTNGHIDIYIYSYVCMFIYIYIYE